MESKAYDIKRRHSENSDNSKIKHMWKMLTSPKRPSPLTMLSKSLTNEGGSSNMKSPLYEADTFCLSAPNSPSLDNKRYHKRFSSSDLLLPYDNSSANSSSTSLRRTLSRSKSKRKNGIEGKFHSDVVGVTFLEICHAKDLPLLSNMTKTSQDLHPFVVATYGASSFRTKSIRHNLNPTWNEKLFFHVRKTDKNFHLKFAIYDREKFSSNNLVAWCQVPIQDIISRSTTTEDVDKKEDDDDDDDDDDDTMDYHTFPLQLPNIQKWKYLKPTLTIRSKFMPYHEIRKMFWFHLVQAYDVEQTGTLSTLEVQSMLETIGSTITETTIDSFWNYHGKDPTNEDEELTIDELIQSLENHMKQDDYWYPDSSNTDTNDWSTDLNDDELDDDDISDTEDGLPFDDLLNAPTITVSEEDVDLAEMFIQEEDHKLFSTTLLDQALPSKRHAPVEKVIRLKECPICRRPNLARKSQMDIITHVATCAANDWTTVDRFLMGNFLTEAYAQRRWFVKLVRKVSYGKYSLGKDNANILVQDRKTGQFIEEKMSVYIRLGMRLVYKRMKSGIQSKGAQRILANLTFKQGRRFDSPKSAKEIPDFIKFHNIPLHEVWKPVSSFKTFNEFFYRKLKPGSRPSDSPDDPTVAVSPADCRMIAFETVSDATKLWIKGREFSLKKLLATNTKQFEGGSLAVFRLAPQDYHRFHSPVDGVVTKIKHISGQYYTVNPMAIRTTIDVFGDNIRTVVWMDSKEFGQVVVVCVGAMLVGSIIMTIKVGDELKRTDEMGYFAFGGSTLVVVFEKDKIEFDHDLLNNSDKTVETLVQVGNHIGTATR